MFRPITCVALGAALLFLPGTGFTQDEPVGNYFQLMELGPTALDEPTSAPAELTSPPTAQANSTLESRDSGPALAPDFINFGYLQTNTVLPYIHFESYTHLATTFVGFDYNGTISNTRISNFRSRPAALRKNGAADRAGTKVIACVNNPCDGNSADGCSSFDPDKLAAVMQSPANRTRLVNSVVKLVTEDTYCHGVNFDFEPSWNATTRDGITLFLQEMRAALPSPYEISVYVHPTYRDQYWGNMPQIIDYVDYVQYSTYDYGTSYAHANADYDSSLAQAKLYMDNGVPADKLILTWASYGRQWTGVTEYNATNDTDNASQGFYEGMFNTTLRQANNGPFTLNYVPGDEIGWHTYTVSGTPYTIVHETPESIELKIAAAKSFPISPYQGRRLRGIGWWSLRWMAKSIGGFNAYDPITNGSVSRPLYYRHIDLLAQEILKDKGQTAFNLESFETDNQHWRDPNESKDTTVGSNIGFDYVTAPAATGKPSGSINAARMTFSFPGSSSRAFLRYEMLNHPDYTQIPDTNATLAPVTKNTRFRGHYYVNGNYSNRTLRLALVDGARQVEVSDPIQLPSSIGWHTFTWDINDPTQINAWNTNELNLIDGNGVVNTAGPDKRDISFLGFILDGGGSGSGTIYFDELTYEHNVPADKKYVINEYRYSDNALEFVEISGPPGQFPSDLQLISYNPDYVPGTTSLTHKVTSLSGKSIPASGLYVIGDTGVPNAGGSTGFVPAAWGPSSNDIHNGSPGGLQLYGSTSGIVYDSVTYRAFGGLSNLARVQARQVTGEGYGWSGEVGPGLAGNGQPYTMGRMPDGADTNHNQADFSAMPPTPGQPNGAAGIVGITHNFSTLPTAAFQTYQNMRLENPAAAGLPPSSPGDTSAFRCIDLSGGGVIAYFGDALTGLGAGLEVTGKLYIPASDHPAQAIAIGFCGTQGSTFFSASPQPSGYEDGYWLIYEHGPNGLADGRSDHPGQFEFLSASNDNQDQVISQPLGARKSLGQLSAAANTWVDFRLKIDPAAAASQQLIAQINNVDVYRGAIPAGGRTHGATMVGFREALGGDQAPEEGTWIDNLLIQTVNTRVEDYQLY